MNAVHIAVHRRILYRLEFVVNFGYFSPRMNSSLPGASRLSWSKKFWMRTTWLRLDSDWSELFRTTNRFPSGCKSKFRPGPLSVN
jgi:hypothetical protein